VHEDGSSQIPAALHSQNACAVRQEALPACLALQSVAHVLPVVLWGVRVPQSATNVGKENLERLLELYQRQCAQIAWQAALPIPMVPQFAKVAHEVHLSGRMRPQNVNSACQGTLQTLVL